MDFDGVDEYVNCGVVNGLNAATEASWSCWVNFASVASGAYVFSQWGAGAGDDQIRVLVNGSSPQLDVYLATNIGFRSSTTSLSTDTWYHLVVTYKASNTPSATRLQVYIDGVAQTNVGFSAQTTLYSPTSNFRGSGSMLFVISMIS